MAIDSIEIEVKLKVSRDTAECCKALLEIYADETDQIVEWSRTTDGHYKYIFWNSEEADLI